MTPTDSQLHRFSKAYQQILRPILFKLDPEKAHNLTIFIGEQTAKTPVKKLLKRSLGVEYPALSQELLGLSFVGPVGLAAGLD